MLGHITSKSIKATRGVNFDKYTLIKHFYSNNYTFTSWNKNILNKIENTYHSSIFGLDRGYGFNISCLILLIHSGKKVILFDLAINRDGLLENSTFLFG
jgi:hypothetical protein